jgi:hypothetical protein
MAPGTWAQLTVSNQNAVLGVGTVSGSMIHYCNSMPWNSFNKSIEIIGMDHNYGRDRYVRYDDATNQFVLIADDVGFGSSVQHGYDHNTVNPHNGDLYHRFTGGPNQFYGVDTKRKSVNSSSFIDLPALPDVSYAQIAIGVTYWSGAFTGAGAQGAYMVFNSGNALGNANDGQIGMFDPLTNSWIYNQTGMAPYYGTNATYHSVAEYSAKKNVAVYGGGNVAPNKLWRLNSDGTFAVMADVPAGKAVGIQNGILVDEPVTGDFLLLSAGELWELDPNGSGSWTKQSGARQPPPDVGIPGPQSAAPNGVDGIIATSIPEYGVVVFIKQTSSSGGTFFVYRHA